MDLWPEYIYPRTKQLAYRKNIGYLGRNEATIPKWKGNCIDSYKAIEMLKQKKDYIFSEKFLNFIQELRER